jgi:DNA-binding response OmpR family regulator
MGSAGHRSPRVLVVEDQMMLGMYIVHLLEDAGCTVVGPMAHVTTALPIALHEPLDAALLDVFLIDETAVPIAFALERRGIPFALISAYGRAQIPAELRTRPYLAKPFMDREITALVSGLVGRAGQG